MRNLTTFIAFEIIICYQIKADEDCALLGYYAPSSGIISYRRFGTTYRSHLQGSRILLGSKGFPATSIRNYHHSLSNNPKERSSRLLRGGSLKSRRDGELGRAFSTHWKRDSFNVTIRRLNPLCAMKHKLISAVGHVIFISKTNKGYMFRLKPIRHHQV